MSNAREQRSTPLAILLAGCLGCSVVLRCTTPVLAEAATGSLDPSRSAHQLVARTVLLLAATVLVALCCWFLVSVLACSLSAVRTGSDHAGGVLRPRVVRVLVATAVGTAVATTGHGAQAGSRQELPRRLEGLAVPDRTYGGVRTHEVTAGESLWSVASGLLSPGADAEAIADAWPRLHRLNRDRVGDDPDILHPGTVLRLPVRVSAPTRGAPR